jgi:hypothetical protein
MDAKVRHKPLSKNRLAALERLKKDRLKKAITEEERAEYERIGAKIRAARNRINTPKKCKARAATQRAIQNGELVKTGVCYLTQEHIGAENTVIHHTQYGDPLDKVFELGGAGIHTRLHVILKAHGVVLE